MFVSLVNRIKKYTNGFHLLYLISVFLCLFCLTFSPHYTPAITQFLTPQEFTRLIRECSEPGGFFQSDNWVSNELSYLNVLEPLDQNKIKGGVYIGVGPEQNFTYIAAIKPELAFIVDIREQNRMQHLYYKILFELAETRAEYLSLLFSKPLDPKKDTMLKKNHNIDSLVTYFYQTLPDFKMCDKTLNRVLELLRVKYEFQLTPSEQSELTYVIATFYGYSLDITYTGLQQQRRSRFPSLGDLLQSRTPTGEQKNPFNSDEDYLYLRKMNLENRIVPITGNFGGSKALKAIAQYVTKQKKTVSAFYVSNVEQYLFRNRTDWQHWIENVKALPITDTSVIIRWTHSAGMYQRNGNTYPPVFPNSWMQGTSIDGKTQLQWIKTFIKNCNEGKYQAYSDLILLNYIK
jgi:hypothetical protein